MMKSWFTKQPSKFSKRGEDGFFDCGDDRDPWASSTIDFFNSGKNLKKKSSKVHEECSKEEEEEISDLGPIPFRKLDASYEEIRKERIKNQPFQEDPLFLVNSNRSSGSSARPIGQAFLQASDSPARSDLSPLPTPPTSSAPSLPTFSSQASSSFRLMDPNQRLFDVAGLKPTRFDEKVQKDTVLGEQPTLQKLDNCQDSSQDLLSQRISLTRPKKESSRETEETWDVEEDRDRPSVLKIVIASTGLFFVAGMLWLISNQNSYDGGEDLPVIEAPQMIKVKPDKKKNPLVPYQDELIYGKLEKVDDEVKEEGERILPQTDFAPELPGMNQKETQEDESEYLEYGKGPQREAESVEPKEEIIDVRDGPPKLVHSSQSEKAPIPEKKQPQILPAKQSPEVDKEGLPLKTSALPEVARTLYFIQLGTLPTRAIAAAEIRRLRVKYKLLSSYGMTIRESQASQGEKNYRILAGPFLSKTRAKQVSQKLGSRYRVVG